MRLILTKSQITQMSDREHLDQKLSTKNLTFRRHGKTHSLIVKVKTQLMSREIHNAYTLKH